MEVKKSPKADLENKRIIFFEIGLLVVIAISLLAFSWTSGSDEEVLDIIYHETGVEEEIIPITQQDEIKPLPPPPVAPIKVPVVASNEFKVVENDAKIDTELKLKSEDDAKTANLGLFQDAKEEETVAEEQVYFIVEEMPTFQGQGIDGFRTYISKSMNYPEIAIKNRIQGRVFVQFVVETDGRISNIKVVHSVDPILDQEAIRVISAAPKWTPGRQRSKPVRVSFTFPIIFKLN